MSSRLVNKLKKMAPVIIKIKVQPAVGGDWQIPFLGSRPRVLCKLHLPVGMVAERKAVGCRSTDRV